ncbi:hypothetical protein DID76_00655 [Candidatus Marinamargulisbacteria bacterium SCGC AG-414-C22]|nr:hypothetical protein DID76_00655 [Candidatus Marinamargulisbacteria bacterium SCGC AG-414-C22]
MIFLKKQDNRRSEQKYLKYIIIGGLFLSILIIILNKVIGHAVVLAIIPDLCVIRKVSQIPCPGCGMTSAVMSLLVGNIYEAMQHHLFAIFVYPVAILVLVRPDFSYKILFSQKVLLIALTVLTFHWGYKLMLWI